MDNDVTCRETPDLAFDGPNIAVHLIWRLLGDFFGLSFGNVP